MNRIGKLYIDGTYIVNNPNWDRQDCLWKATHVKDILDEYNIRANSICDVGCGAGDVLVHLKRFYPSCTYTGYDISPQVRQYWEQHKAEGIEFHCEDFLTNDKEYYDCILLLDVIEHLSDPFGFLEAVRGRAKYFVFHFPLDLSASSVLRERPLLEARRKTGHIHYFTKGLALAILRDANFNILKYRYTNASLSSPERSIKTRIAAVPRHIAYLINKDLGVRLLGGETLLVLAGAGGDE